VVAAKGKAGGRGLSCDNTPQWNQWKYWQVK